MYQPLPDHLPFTCDKCGQFTYIGYGLYLAPHYLIVCQACWLAAREARRRDYEAHWPRNFGYVSAS